MPHVTRRRALAMLAAGGTAGLLVADAASRLGRDDTLTGGFRLGSSWVGVENRRGGASSWRIGAYGTKPADDDGNQVKGYASATSVNRGDPIDFHVCVGGSERFNVGIYRLGYYGGLGARQMTASETLTGARVPIPAADPQTGRISCTWPVSWTLAVPPDWPSGLYLAVFTTAGGWRSVTPFVVRDDSRRGGLCVILPFTTYQAYNQWPLDGRRGRSLYYGYGAGSSRGGEVDPDEVPVKGNVSYDQRARKVSFDRPYAASGLPLRFDLDQDAVWWLEQGGYPVTYATSVDLHAGRVDPDRYAGLLFTGHDEYWSAQMRTAVERAVQARTSLAYLGANNMYWHIRLEPELDGRPDRVVVCYRKDDPEPDASGPTVRWRDLQPDGAVAEQRILGVQYTGIVHSTVPLVVSSATHWFWQGCRVTVGSPLRGLVGGEADGLTKGVPRPAGVQQTLLTSSRFRTPSGIAARQNTSVYETPRGNLVFVAGTLAWHQGLVPGANQDQAIQTGTANLLNRIVGRT